MDASELFKAISDPNRLRILHLLSDRPLCVCDLEAALGLEQSNLSRHLAKLRQAGLVDCERRATFAYYRRTAVAGPYAPVVGALYQALDADPDRADDRNRLTVCCNMSK